MVRYTGVERDNRDIRNHHAHVERPEQLPDRPLFWRVAEGVLYAEMSFSRTIRPPLLTEWESERVSAFRSIDRRNRWIAGRALAKALVRERFGFGGIIEIRESSNGASLVYRRGMPLPNVWLDIACRGGRVVAVIADRPVALDLRGRGGADHPVVDQVVAKHEQRTTQRMVQESDVARLVVWSAKESALRVTRSSPSDESLKDVLLEPNHAIAVGDVKLHLLAVRTFEQELVTVVGRQLLHERPVTKVVLHTPAGEVDQDPVRKDLERTLARAKRIAEARARWHQRLRWA